MALAKEATHGETAKHGEESKCKAVKVPAKDDEEMYIHDDPKIPIILKMKTDFTIELKQVL